MVTGSSSARITALAQLLPVACGDITDPPTERITLDICVNRWIAYQNDGAEWVLLSEGNGTYTFAATRRLAIALPSFSLSGWVITADYLTPEQAVAPGPPLATETFTVVATTPYRRIRAEVRSQPEYAAAISIAMSQISSSRWSEATLTAMREYFSDRRQSWTT